MLKTFIVFVLMIGFLISIHELGHLIAAKWAGVYCYEYSIGMGPLLFKRKGKETQFSIRALPIGGYVAMAGETEDSQEAYPDIEVPKGRHLFEVPKWKQAIVMAAGIVMNIIVAFVFMYVAVLGNGGYVEQNGSFENVVLVENDSPAQQAGLLVGDRIIAIVEDDQTINLENGKTISTYIDDQPLEIIVDRDGEEVNLMLTPQYNQESQKYMIGIGTNRAEFVKANAFSAIKGSWIMVCDISSQLFNALKGMVTGDGLKNLSGIVGVYQATDQIVQTGVVNVLVFVGMFSLNLAIFNALPLPALDGGRIVLLGIEKVIGRPLNKKVVNGLIMGSFIFLIGLTVVITFKDIIGLFN